MRVTGRLAPTPSGHLHLGNALAFAAAWLSVRAQRGELLLRIEDLDRGRAREDVATAQRDDLRWLGIHWDREVTPQSQRAYALDGVPVFRCDCARAQRLAGACVCRDHPKSLGPWRFRAPREHITFTDRVWGPQDHSPDEDPVVMRADGEAAYPLAVVIDDLRDGVTEVVRGADLLPATATQILLYRMGVGFGEAGGSPPSYSLISDYFPAAKRGTALAIYSLGVPVGSMLGAFFGGKLALEYGWRTAFVIIGLPGIILGILMLILVREPKRGGLDALAEGATEHPPAPPILTAIGAFFANRTLVLTAVSSAMSAFVGYAGLVWNPQFLETTKGMAAADVATYYALALGVTGIVGTVVSGWLVDRLGHKDRRWFAWVPAIAFVLSIPFWFGILWAPTWQIAMLFLLGPMLMNQAYLAPALTVAQNAVPPAQRTMTGAILLFVLNLVGLGVGPVYVGWIADRMEPAHGDQALVYGYAAVIPFVVLTVVAHLAASYSIARDKRLAAAL